MSAAGSISAYQCASLVASFAWKSYPGITRTFPPSAHILLRQESQSSNATEAAFAAVVGQFRTAVET